MINHWIDYGGQGPELIFLHANGYPPGCYLELFEGLKKDHHIRAFVQRPLWPGSQPEDIQDWRPLTQDLLDATNAQPPMFAVGHSMGGIATLRAALQEPERFKAIVLIDPVLFPPHFIILWNMVRALGLAHRLHPLIPSARARRRNFDDLERLFNGYRRRETFKYMSNTALRNYVQAIACPDGEKDYTLCYTPEWEARIYYTGIWRDLELWRQLPKLKPPLLILRGAETDTFFAGTAQRVTRSLPTARIESLERSTHLVPLERPEQTSAIILDFLKELP